MSTKKKSRAGGSRPAGRLMASVARSDGRPSQPGLPRIADRGDRSRVLRIIGGAWRGRRLRFPAQSQIRPTPDRVRETLFNWLGPHVRGARCLDLFAGSGALGLEALSRGASAVTFVERDAVAARELRARLREWEVTGAAVEQADALQFLRTAAQPVDIAFLDPPFGSELLGQSCSLLEGGHWLRPSSRIYVETDARSALPELPPNWTLTRTKQAGAVGYHLLTRE